MTKMKPSRSNVASLDKTKHLMVIPFSRSGSTLSQPTIIREEAKVVIWEAEEVTTRADNTVVITTTITS